MYINQLKHGRSEKDPLVFCDIKTDLETLQTAENLHLFSEPTNSRS